jgi:ubiquinone/menaquinone biosynthesis C-methylase UbiE
MEQVTCLLCGSNENEVYLKAPSYDWAQEFTVCMCNRCQFLFVNPRPSVTEIATFYPPSYHALPQQSNAVRNRVKYWLQYSVLQTFYGWPPRLSPVIARLLANKLEPYFGRAFPYALGRRLLDIGSGNGEFLLWVRQLDSSWTLTGVEPSSNASEMCRKFGLQVWTGTLESKRFPESSFDVVTMWNVLEHLHDPLGTLQEVRRVLAPGGYVALVVPNISSSQAKRFGRDWWVLQLPQHLVFFTPFTLHEMLERAGFRLLRIQLRRMTYSHMSLRRQQQSPQTKRKPSHKQMVVERVLDFFREGDVIKAIAQKE